MDSHLIYVARHGHANSNIGLSHHGTDIFTLNDKTFSEFLHSRNVVKHGDFLPDNLTRHGKEELRRYVDEHPEFLDSLDLILCSPLTRSILAAKGLAQTNKARIVCLFGLAENTKWIQDIPPITYVEGGKRYASTVDLAGGLAEGTLLGEEVVDLTVETLEDQWDSWNEPQKRFSALETYKPLDEIEEQDTRLRIQIRDLVQTIAKSKGRNVKALIVTHGGKINTLTGHYRTQLELNNGEWELKSSSCFANLGTAVYKFSSATDEKAELVEVDESEHHAQLLGSDYQRPRGFTYIDSSGKAADERQLYEMFLKKTHEEVIARKSTPILWALVRWDGTAC
ncbi:hypothetical protein FOPG_17949 [Fusarium oxysporum f. sp. conglutinans race 2 54008]|uniref:Histidine phosphatase superfamily n=1 Tax=Fusarium oxysporum f. sp. conglutinans race 2 54008 TaxID=1089457 RepID=X0H194_FUSOX|nr:hypothetical protein FOPG_17949 [Fusarium oxysporum f. sp. conglutinans race 2 54008]KAG6991550.1 hypothetical protein FocnCong_v017549 [Fusarium oxysporum f. sp. conglutinans]